MAGSSFRSLAFSGPGIDMANGEVDIQFGADRPAMLGPGIGLVLKPVMDMDGLYGWQLVSDAAYQMQQNVRIQPAAETDMQCLGWWEAAHAPQ